MSGHRCHWPDCQTVVHPSFWGCIEHWCMLPKPIRRKIWTAYRAGQEIRKDPSAEYIAATREAREWIYANREEVPNEPRQRDPPHTFA